MFRRCGLLLLLFITNAPAEEPAIYRHVTCRVVDEDGLPVRHIQVALRGLMRDAVGFDPSESNKLRGWNFETDANGKFKARFGKFRQYDHEQATGLIEPGYGEFYFVTRPENSAGGVSCRILNLSDEDLARRREAEVNHNLQSLERNEWVRGANPPLVLRAKYRARPIEIALRNGLSLTGRILDTTGLPVRGEELNIFLDLGSDTHTGHGGEIFEQQTVTDRHGYFYFRHIYPNTFYLELLNHSMGPPYWMRTRVRDRWVDKVEDQITPRHHEWELSLNYEKHIDMRLIVSRTEPYRYFGRVTDLNDRGVANAEVEIRCSLHEPERTFEDDHSYWWKTKTDAAGNYSLRVGTRFVNAIWVTAGQETGGDNCEEGELLAPGRYDITVRPKTNR